MIKNRNEFGLCKEVVDGPSIKNMKRKELQKIDWEKDIKETAHIETLHKVSLSITIEYDV